MSGVQPHRSVTPLLDFIRSILRGRYTKTNALRFADKLAARTQPQPNLPGGPYAKTTGIYYYQRDARREVEPPLLIANRGQILIASDSNKNPKEITPGKVYQAD